MKFQDLRLAVKQWISFAAILLIMAGVSVVSIYQMDRQRDEIDSLNSFWIPSISAISEINLDVSNLRIYQLEQALQGFTEDQLTAQERVVPLLDSIEANQTEYERLTASGYVSEDFVGDTHFDSFLSHWDDFQLQYMNLFFTESEEESGELLNEAGVHYDALSESLEEIIDINKNGSSEAASRARANFNQTRGFIMVVYISTLLISAVLAAMLIRSITTPVKKLEDAARTVAGGDLKVQIPVNSKDEIGNLARSFNDMMASLARAQEQLLLNEKMASLGQLTAGVAHEIKNPLNFVNNFSILTSELVDEIQEEMENNKDARVGDFAAQIQELFDDLKMNVDKIASHGKRADNIVRSMLLHSRGRSTEERAIDLNKLLAEYINLAFHSMRADHSDAPAVQIDQHLDPQVGEMTVVPQDLGRVFINLMSNAFYAVLQRKDEEGFVPRVVVRTRRQKGQVVIEFADNGVGIPLNEHQKVFEPFYTTKPSGEGTGLGLSLSYDIITQGHGGTLILESKPGRGTTFTITLPVA